MDFKRNDSILFIEGETIYNLTFCEKEDAIDTKNL